MAEYITCQDEKGSVNISEDVVAVVVGAAITEVEGIAGLAGSVGSDLIELFSKKNTTRGIKVQFEGTCIILDIPVTVRYGFAIASVAKKAQDAVTAAVEAMIGFTPVVNVHVSGVAFDK
ncbi:MAG: Asp23/Gls24 family envelope stress response protein [Oscillospiraceae bacterium]|nr:Asp23/Gls24 family envelope stress response protein [Oscillospiraceae bacterium]